MPLECVGGLQGWGSGLPAVAVDEGGPSSIVADGETGRLCEPDAAMHAAAVLQLTDSPAMIQLAEDHDRVTQPEGQPRIKLVRAA